MAEETVEEGGLALLLLAEPAGHQFAIFGHGRRTRDGRAALGRARLRANRPVNIGRILRLQDDVFASPDGHSWRFTGVVVGRRRHHGRRLAHHRRLLLVAVSDFKLVAVVARFPRGQHRVRAGNVARAAQRRTGRSRSSRQGRHVFAALSFPPSRLQLLGASAVGYRRHRRDVGHGRRVQVDGALALGAGRALHRAAVTLGTVDRADRLFSRSIQKSPRRLKKRWTRK